jgi:hypothetical protein
VKAKSRQVTQIAKRMFFDLKITLNSIAKVSHLIFRR